MALPARLAEVTSGKAYYVDDATGDDSRTEAVAQNPATPWKTLQKAINTYILPGIAGSASGGAKIILRAGTYQETGAFVGIQATGNFGTLSGTRLPNSGNVLEICNYPGETVVVKQSTGGSTENHAIRANGSTNHHVRIRGLIIEGAGDGVGGGTSAGTGDGGGITWNNGSWLEVDQCTIRFITSATKAQGIFTHTITADMAVYNTKVYGIGGIGSLSGSNQEHGMYLQGDRITIVNNVSHNNRFGFGFQFFGDSSIAPGHIVSHCLAFNNKKSGMTFDGSAYTGILVYNSIFYDNDEGGLTARGGATMTATNCIANANATNFDQQSASTLTQVSCLTSDPLLDDPSSHDFDLETGSPAIDFSEGSNSPSTDLAGVTRSGLADCGPLEYVAPPVTSRPRRALMGWGR